MEIKLTSADETDKFTIEKMKFFENKWIESKKITEGLINDIKNYKVSINNLHSEKTIVTGELRDLKMEIDN